MRDPRPKERLIGSVPAEQRGAIVSKTLEYLNIDPLRLTKQQQFELALEQIRARTRKYTTNAIIVAVLTLLTAAVTVIAMTQQSNKVGPNNNSDRTTVSLPDGRSTGQVVQGWKSFSLPLQGMNSPLPCDDPRNLDTVFCDWFQIPVIPQETKSEIEVSLELTVDINRVQCDYPQPRGAVQLYCGNQHADSGMLGTSQGDQFRQKYSLNTYYKVDGDQSVPIIVKAHPTGCFGMIFVDGTLKYREIKR